MSSTFHTRVAAVVAEPDFSAIRIHIQCHALVGVVHVVTVVKAAAPPRRDLDNMAVSKPWAKGVAHAVTVFIHVCERATCFAVMCMP